MNARQSSSFGRRLLALVPASLPSPAIRRVPAPVRRLVGRVRSAVQDALDLPSRTEMHKFMGHLNDVTQRLDDLSRSHEPPPSAPATAPSESDAERKQALADLETERQKLKKIRKELKRERKGKGGKSKAGKGKAKAGKKKTVINVGSPKSMKDRKHAKRNGKGHEPEGT